MSFPASPVMAARDDAGLDAFGQPRADHEVTNLGLHAHEIASAHAEFRRMTRVQPERIRVRDFVKPLRIRTARVNLNRKSKRRDQNRLIFFQVLWMSMAL